MSGKKFSASLLRLARKTERNIKDRGLEGVSGSACVQKQRGAGASQIILLLSANLHIPSFSKWFTNGL